MTRRKPARLTEHMQRRKILICVVHLPPLPGSPRWGPDTDIVDIIDFAVRSAREAEEGGADGVIIENFNDNPFAKRVRNPVTIAAMTTVVREVVRDLSIPVGVNLLRNSCTEALAIAYASGASLVRCNVYCETAVCPEGIIEPVAHEVVKLRTYLRAQVEIFADILVKHASPLHRLDLADLVEDYCERCLADAIIVTGRRTGKAPDPELLRVITTYSKVPVLVGSGVTPTNIRQYSAAHGFIVGTYVKDPRTGIIDRSKVEELKRALGSL